MWHAKPICLRLFCDWVRAAAWRTLAMAGSSSPSSTARMAITTSSWNSVKAWRGCRFMAILLSEVEVDDLAAVARDQRLPRPQIDLLGVDDAGAAVAEGDADQIVEAAQRRQAALAAAADVRLVVVEGASGGEGALQKAAVDPAGAAVAGDVFVVLPVLHA